MKPLTSLLCTIYGLYFGLFYVCQTKDGAWNWKISPKINILPNRLLDIINTSLTDNDKSFQGPKKSKIFLEF